MVRVINIQDRSKSPSQKYKWLRILLAIGFLLIVLYLLFIKVSPQPPPKNNIFQFGKKEVSPQPKKKNETLQPDDKVEISLPKGKEPGSIPIEAMVTFKYNSSELSSHTLSVIKDIADAIKNKAGRLILEGHTCCIGTNNINLKLSKSRVNKVAATFRKMGLGTKISFFKFYYGEDRPIASNETPEGKSKNRRVKIKFNPKEPAHKLK
jgi:outer membrane protein OmpA-like peptidoglycan-associated protein